MTLDIHIYNNSSIKISFKLQPSKASFLFFENTQYKLRANSKSKKARSGSLAVDIRIIKKDLKASNFIRENSFTNGKNQENRDQLKFKQRELSVLRIRETPI